MTIPRRRFLHFAVGAAALPTTSHISRAQAYPARTIMIILRFSAGGGTDVTARIIGQYMSRVLGQQIIVENVTGAVRDDWLDPCNARKTGRLHHHDGSHRNPCVLRVVLPESCL